MKLLSRVALAVAAAAMAASIALNSGLWAVLAIGAALAALEIALLTRAAGGFTALVVPVVSVNLVLLSAPFLWDGIRDESIVSLHLESTPEMHILSAKIGIVFAFAFTVGALLGGPRGITNRLAGVSAIRIPVSNGALVAAGYLGIALTIYARRGALLRGGYNEVSGPDWAASISNSITPLAMLALCIAAARPGRWRVVAAFGIGIWFLILFGRASRTVAALPALVVFAKALSTGARVGKVSGVVVLVLTTFLLQLPLVTRANPGGVGILAIAEFVAERPEKLVEGFGLAPLLGNVLFSGPLTSIVALRPIDLHALWVSLNPSPGFMTDWPYIRSSLRLDESTPYNALGELAAHGWIPLVIVSAAVGFVIALASNVSARIRGAYGFAASLLVLGVTSFFAVSILQYNLRSSVRLVWYVVVGVVVLAAAAVLVPGPAEQEQGDELDFVED